MTTEQLLINFALPVLALVVGYMTATLLERKTLTGNQQQLIEAQANFKQLDESFTELTTTHSGISKQYRSIELEQQKLQTQYESATDRKEELEQDLNETENKAESNLLA